MAGRPSTYNPELAETICDRVATGESLRTICAEDGMPNRETVMRWERNLPEFAAKCAQAREWQGHAAVDQMPVIVGQVLDGKLDPRAAQVALGNMEWRAERLHAKRYGNKLDLNVAGELKTMTDEQVEAKLATLMAKGQRP